MYYEEIIRYINKIFLCHMYDNESYKTKVVLEALELVRDLCNCERVDENDNKYYNSVIEAIEYVKNVERFGVSLKNGNWK